MLTIFEDYGEDWSRKAITSLASACMFCDTWGKIRLWVVSVYGLIWYIDNFLL